MDQTEKMNPLAFEPAGKLMRKYCVPCVLSLLAGALYNIVDQIFIANTPELGSYGNAANAVVFPLTVIALAIAVMIGDGCCAFVSLCFGRKQPAEAADSVGSSIVTAIVVSIVLTAIYLLFAKPIVLAFGGGVNERTLSYSLEYFFWISLGVPFYLFGQAMNPIIRADGSPAFAMAVSLAGAAINVVLDPLFLFVFHWGMMGAAVATIIGQIVTFLFSVGYLLRLKQIHLKASSFMIRWRILGKTLSLGICSFLSQIALVAAMAAMNRMIQYTCKTDPVFSNPEYTQIPMAVIGIVMKFFQIVISIVVGTAAGTIPVAGFNMGAGLYGRVKTLLEKLLILETLTGVIALIIAEFFPEQILDLFGASSESIEYLRFGMHSFRLMLCMVVLACINKASFIFLQAMGKAGESTLLSLVRELVFGVSFALILPHYFGLDGVLLSMPVSDALTFVLSAIVLAQTFHSLRVLEKEKQLQTALESR